ncbi:MAG: PrgI family protein [Minisyncoccia bacterium]
MEYQVPQFIEVEDKLIGPLTLKQFLYLAGAAGLTVVVFAYLPTIVAAMLAIPVVALSVALSFYKINGKPFIEVLEAGFNYLTSKKLMLWKYTAPTAEAGQAAAAATAAAEAAARPVRGAPRLTRGKLSELAWSLDVPTGGESVAVRKSNS